MMLKNLTKKNLKMTLSMMQTHWCVQLLEEGEALVSTSCSTVPLFVCWPVVG